MGLGPVDYIVYIQGVRFRACLLSKPAHALCVRWQAIKGLAGGLVVTAQRFRCCRTELNAIDTNKSTTTVAQMGCEPLGK